MASPPTRPLHSAAGPGKLEQAMTGMAVDARIKSGHDGLEVVASFHDMRGRATHDAFNTA